MHNSELYSKASFQQIFHTELSNGATFSDPIYGNFNARMSANGYVVFSDKRREGPLTNLETRFVSCGYVSDKNRSYMPWNSDSICDTSLDISPEEFLRHPELFYPFARRLSVVALMLEQIPNQLPEAYPKLRGRFPYKLFSDVSNFLQCPTEARIILDSKYGIDIDSFTQDPNNIDLLENKRTDIESRLKKIQEYYRYD